MNEFFHAQASAAKYGGKPEDYLAVHSFLDQSKEHHGDLRHRALLHNTFGIKLAEQVFGITIANSDGKQIPVRNLLEEHILQDLGRLPSVSDWLNTMPLLPWMGGLKSYNRKPKRRFETTRSLSEILHPSRGPITYD